MKDQCVSLNSAEVLLRCRNTLETALFAAAAPPLPPESPILFRERDRQFESASLQRRVRSELLPVEVRPTPPWPNCHTAPPPPPTACPAASSAGWRSPGR